MYVCQWHLDIPYGKQGEAVKIMKAWGEEKFRTSEFKRAKGTKLMVGHIGASASHIVDEYYFESLADFEAALADMTHPQFTFHSDALAPYIIPGSQEWKIFHVVE